jgi:alpha-ketoglutarate-dependent taurine dioxygenase
VGTDGGRRATGGEFQGGGRRAVRLTTAALVKVGRLASGQALPALVEPDFPRLDAAAWAASNRSFVEAELHRAGALLFRGFGLGTLAEFETFVRAFSPELMEYGERSSPRSRLGDGVYTSTDYPAEQAIMLHNEQSYTLNWPMKIWFFCLQAAERGGRTPLADSRRILGRLPATLAEGFRRKGVMYVRNYNAGLGLPWQEVFQTNDRALVESYCRKEGIEVEWRRGGEQLRTRQVRPAVRRHPQTGEEVWFNHATFFHLAGLEASAREALLAAVEESEVPFNTFYGDGAAIEPSVLAEIRAAYGRETASFDWQRGDVLMVDNMLAAHGRESYEGGRQIAVAMAEPFNRAGSAA